MIEKEKFIVLMLQETKCHKDTMIQLTKKLWKGSEVVTTHAEGFEDVGHPLESKVGYL